MKDSARSPNEEPNDSPGSAGSKYIHDAYDTVAEIGKGRRWYDLPYKLLSWLQYSWPKKVLPRRWRLGLNYLLNLLIPFNEHDRHKVWSLEDPH
jgi:hypothetical protein